MRNTLKKVSQVCAVSVGTAMLLSGCGAIDTVITEVKAKFNTSEMETELAEGQRKAEITVMSIVGNELTYRENETEAPETEMELETGSEQAITKSGVGSEASAEAMSSEMSRAGRGGFSRENFGQMSSEDFPGGMDRSQMPSGELPEGMDRSQMPNMGEMEEMFAEMAGETVYLPVGIKVHADNGKDTTFSILEEGDVLQVLFETKEDGTEVITEIWMEGTY